MNPAIEAMNYARDPRTQGKAKPPILYLDNGEELELPTRWMVCPVCKGAGSHVNPAIDCGGISAAAFAEDPDFAEEYLGGAYDQLCNRCGGRTTVPTVDWQALTDEQARAYRRQLDEEADDRAMELAELRAGA